MRLCVEEVEMSNPPAFQLYAADFYMDTLEWTCDEIGLYLRLLLIEWINGPLPNDHKQLINLVKTHHKTFNKAWKRVGKKFINNGQGLINERLEKEREKQEIWREKSRLGGIKSGKVRRRVVEPPYEPTACNQKATLQSSSSIKRKYIKEKATEVLAYLNEKKGSRYQRTDEIIARLKDGGTVEECKKIIDIKSQDPHFIENPQHLNPQTLFRKKHWDKYLNEKHKPKDLWG